MRTSRAYYTVLALSALSIRMSGPYGVLWMQRGLGVSALFIRQVAYAATQGVLDYPTGALADKWGRGKVYAFGYALLGLSFFVLAAPLSPLTLVLSSVMTGAGLAFAGGALEAWVTDQLKADSQKNVGPSPRLETVLGRGDSISFAAMALAGLAGSGLNWVFGIRAPILASGAFGLLTAVFVLAVLPENHGGLERPSYTRILKDGLGTVLGSRFLISIGLAMLLFHTGYQMMGMLDAPLLSERNVPDSVLGIVYAGADAFTSLGSLAASRLMPRWKPSAIALGTSLIWGVGLVALVSVGHPALAVVLFLGLDTLFGLRSPALKAWRNSLIPSAVRATVLSVLSSVAFLGSTFILAVITPVSDRIGLNGVMLAAAGLAAVSGISLAAARASEGSSHAHRLSL